MKKRQFSTAEWFMDLRSKAAKRGYDLQDLGMVRGERRWYALIGPSGEICESASLAKIARHIDLII